MTPGTRHHAILRGMQRGQMVADKQELAAVGERLRAVATITGPTGYTWVLLTIQLGLPLAETPRQLGASTLGIVKAIARAEKP